VAHYKVQERILELVKALSSLGRLRQFIYRRRRQISIPMNIRGRKKLHLDEDC